MCEFCESITNKNKEILWQVRSTYADDNVCNYVNGEDCNRCKGCKMYFKLSGTNYNENTYVGVTYMQQIMSENDTKVIINPFSEGIQFNYCPFCGKQISENIKDFKDYYNCNIEIRDKED